MSTLELAHVCQHAPRPLRNAPIPLLEDQVAQLSFGERAALEGILCQLHPRFSVEIGSAQGGSLLQLLRHSESVHSFDLAHGFACDHPGYHPHTGDSHVLLSAWLSRLPDAQVDFAFVDGDHSTEGVRADLLDLMNSPACRQTVILVHDTSNPDVRLGCQIPLDHPAVVYHEIDFVEGYRFAEGPFKGDQHWGGLGLIVTGDRETDGYGETPRQTLYLRREHG